MAASFSGGCRACAYAVCSTALLPQSGQCAGWEMLQAGLSKWTWLVGSPPMETCLIWGGCTSWRPEVVVCMVTGGLAGTTVETWYWRGLCLWDAFTPLILEAGRESCLSWVCLCLCLSGSCVFVVFLSRFRGLAWSPLSQSLLSRRLLSCRLTSSVVLGVRFFGLRGYGSDAHASTVGLEGSALTMVMCSGHFLHGFYLAPLPCSLGAP